MPSQYPAALDTTTTLSTAVNGLQTTLTGDHTSGATTITVASTSGAAGAGYVTIDSEVVKYTGVTPTTLTGCTRGADGTAQASHNNGAVVKFGLVADHHNSLAAGLIAVQTKVGLNTNGASASTIDGNQLAANTVTNAALVDSSILFRRLKLENNITRIGPAIQNPANITPGAGVWGNWGTAYTITPAVVSDLMIFLSANISSTGASAFLMQVLVDGAITALNPLAGADVTVANKTLCVSLIDYVHNATVAAHTIQVQLKPIAAVTLGAGATGLDIFVLATPST